VTTTEAAKRSINGLPGLPEGFEYWVRESAEPDTWGTHVTVGIHGQQGTIATGRACGALTDRRVVKAAKRAHRELDARIAEVARKERYAHGIVPAPSFGKAREGE
jgi:hypothetical protein